MTIKSDIEIAQEAKPLPITDIADACGMDGAYIEQYGRYKAKIDNRFLKEANRPDGKLVLVDYKTDYVENSDILIRRYEAQVRYYTRALEQMTGKRVAERYLYSFRFGAIEV